jgi:hypothetical protein
MGIKLSQSSNTTRAWAAAQASTRLVGLNLAAAPAAGVVAMAVSAAVGDAEPVVAGAVGEASMVVAAAAAVVAAAAAEVAAAAGDAWLPGRT